MWPFKKKSEPAPTSEPQPTGVLFGLDPPTGFQFKVQLHREKTWFVYIMRGDDEVCSDLVLDYMHPGATDAELIVIAAKSALAKFERKQMTADLVGLYPPKRTGVPIESLGREHGE